MSYRRLQVLGLRSPELPKSGKFTQGLKLFSGAISSKPGTLNIKPLILKPTPCVPNPRGPRDVVVP